MRLTLLFLATVFFTFGSSIALGAAACKSEVSLLDPIFGGAYVPQGTGLVDDTQAIQNVLDYRVCIKGIMGITCTQPCPPPAVVNFPVPPKNFRVSSLKIHGNTVWNGPGRMQGGLQSDGSGPLVIADKAPNFKITGLRIYGLGYPALKITQSSNFIVRDSFIASDGRKMGGTNAVEIVDSYRGILEANYLLQSGTGWAVSAMNNSNSLSIIANIVSGGTAGNGIDIGQSQAVHIRDNTMEMNAGYGIRIGGSTAVGTGRCFNVDIVGNYLEQSLKPISLGEIYQVGGLTVTGNYVANNPSIYLVDRAYFILVGRVTSSRISQNSYSGKKIEPFVKFLYVPDSAHRVEVPDYAADLTLENNVLYGVSSPYALEGFPAAQALRLFQINKISFGYASQAH